MNSSFLERIVGYASKVRSFAGAPDDVKSDVKLDSARGLYTVEVSWVDPCFISYHEKEMTEIYKEVELPTLTILGFKPDSAKFPGLFPCTHYKFGHTLLPDGGHLRSFTFTTNMCAIPPEGHALNMDGAMSSSSQ